MRLPISVQQNNWYNSQNVDDTNLKLEQNYNDQIQSSIIDNHFGSGVLLESLVPNVLFDSASAVGILDGKGVPLQNQPSDTNYGNQLSFTLSGSAAAGKRAVKILVIGLDFNNNLQYDTLAFHTNETQITRKHYTKILQLFFNDFIGLSTESLNLGGRLIVTDVKPLTLSRDAIMVAQDVEPNVILRDFYITGGLTLSNALTAALPSYNIDVLNITTSYNQLRQLLPNDVTSQVGQKFQATTNNIQKITLLMSIINTINPNDLAWTGDLLISIYPLQSSLSCSTDIVPSLAIEFPPSNTPVAQLSVNYNSLLSSGTQLNTVPQPVDFVFSNSPVGAGTALVVGDYYAITVKRSGTADKCDIQIATGSDRTPNSNEVLFDGNNWIDVTEEDLWFQVWTDSGKISDGQAYDGGHGVIIPKTVTDQLSGATIDNCLGQIYFTSNQTYYGLVKADVLESDPQQDERTGNQIDTKKQFVPDVSFITSLSLLDLQKTSDPLVIGAIKDENVKSFNPNSTVISALLHEYAIVGNQLLIKIIDDPNDVRYDLNILNLVTELLNGNLISAKFTPNAANPSGFYRVSKAELISMTYGDTNGDGVIDEDDLLRASSLIGSNLISIPSQTEYNSATNYFGSDVGVYYQVINPNTLAVVASGSDGIISPNPQDPTQAIFTSTSANFTSIPDLSSLSLVINSSINPGNVGTFFIIGVNDSHDIVIRKTYYNMDTLLEIFRTDVNGDMLITDTDIGYINNYVFKVQPFPATTSPANRIGTQFNVIKISLEQFVDRGDDYNINVTTRSSVIHALPDILKDGYDSGYSMYGTNLLSSPMQFSIGKELTWSDSLISVTSTPRYVQSAFEYQSGANKLNCNNPGVLEDTYPLGLTFDGGKNDVFIPNDLIMNLGGNIMTSDGYFHKVDVEIGNIVIELPSLAVVAEKTMNIFTDFIADFSGNGTTRLGYKALKFADCSFVGMDALEKGQIQFSVSIQSLSPESDGYTCSGGIAVVDNRLGVYIDQMTGLLYFNFANLYDDMVMQALTPKIQITVLLKKAGWNNKPLYVSWNKTQNILGLTPTVVTCGIDTIILLS